MLKPRLIRRLREGSSAGAVNAGGRRTAEYAGRLPRSYRGPRD